MRNGEAFRKRIFPGLQKDRYRGTRGTKEGLSSIGTFRSRCKTLGIFVLFQEKQITKKPK